ncbi:hypothetical protein DFH06DRAFT_1446649 [Mycena polygramma]|nr:hypothetical protein DFH06DRAFT_1446649 [Mycena polygramma]
MERAGRWVEGVGGAKGCGCGGSRRADGGCTKEEQSRGSSRGSTGGNVKRRRRGRSWGRKDGKGRERMAGHGTEQASKNRERREERKDEGGIPLKAVGGRGTEGGDIVGKERVRGGARTSAEHRAGYAAGRASERKRGRRGEDGKEREHMGREEAVRSQGAKQVEAGTRQGLTNGFKLRKGGTTGADTAFTWLSFPNVDDGRRADAVRGGEQ